MVVTWCMSAEHYARPHKQLLNLQPVLSLQPVVAWKLILAGVLQGNSSGT